MVVKVIHRRDVSQLVQRLVNRSSSNLFADQPEYRRDLRLAAILLSELMTMVPNIATLEVDDKDGGPLPLF